MNIGTRIFNLMDQDKGYINKTVTEIASAVNCSEIRVRESLRYNSLECLDYSGGNECYKTDDIASLLKEQNDLLRENNRLLEKRG